VISKITGTPEIILSVLIKPCVLAI